MFVCVCASVYALLSHMYSPQSPDGVGQHYQGLFSDRHRGAQSAPSVRTMLAIVRGFFVCLFSRHGGTPVVSTPCANSYSNRTMLNDLVTTH